MRVLTKQTLKIFWTHSVKYRWQLIVLSGGIVILTFFQAYLPLLSRDLINAVVARDFAGSRWVVILLFVWGMVRLLVWRLVLFVNNYFQPKVMSDLTNTCYRYIQQHSFGFFSANFTGGLVTKVRRYERAFEQLADQILYDLGRSLLDVAVMFGVLLWQYRVFGWIVLVWTAVLLAFTYWFSRFKLAYDIRRAAADTKTTAQLADSITNNINIKLFANYAGENDRFSETTREQFLLRKKSFDIGTVGDLVQGSLMVIAEFVVMYLAVLSWWRGVLVVGDIALLQVYLGRIFDRLWNTGRNIRTIYESIADANEMTELLVASHEIADAPHAGALSVSAGGIEFRDVHFGYRDEMSTLQGFHLAVAPGERVALIGPSGGGKSTIAKLLLRLHDVRSGGIFVDGQNIADVTQDSLRSAIALVPQDPILFHRSLIENIRYAKPGATDDEVIRAAKLAHAHEFIVSFPEGYDTLVGERGVRLSGGERQRVAIARAILKDAPILILDEATSSLDSESEQYIQEALVKLMRGRTTIVIAHRLSTIMQMDRIVVIEGGRIIEEGKHAELLKIENGIYQKLWEIQAGGFAPNAA